MVPRLHGHLLLVLRGLLSVALFGLARLLTPGTFGLRFSAAAGAMPSRGSRWGTRESSAIARLFEPLGLIRSIVMAEPSVRRLLREGSRVYATALLSPSPKWCTALARTGIDFVFVDAEHAAVDRETLSWICHTFSALGIPPVVRIPSPDPHEASKVLDGGAAGFVAPYLETATQCRELAGVARYRPLKGERLHAAVRDPTTLEPELGAYLEKRNASTVFLANIESVPAMERLDELLAEDIDGVLIGPHDLSCSLGVPEEYGHPRFVEAVETILGRARAARRGAGIYWWPGVGDEAHWASVGANLIMHTTTTHHVASQLEHEMNALRGRLGDPPRSRGR